VPGPRPGVGPGAGAGGGAGAEAGPGRGRGRRWCRVGDGARSRPGAQGQGPGWCQGRGPGVVPGVAGSSRRQWGAADGRRGGRRPRSVGSSELGRNDNVRMLSVLLARDRPDGSRRPPVAAWSSRCARSQHRLTSPLGPLDRRDRAGTRCRGCAPDARHRLRAGNWSRPVLADCGRARRPGWAGRAMVVWPGSGDTGSPSPRTGAHRQPARRCPLSAILGGHDRSGDRLRAPTGSRPSRRTRRESPLAAPPWPVNESLRSWSVNRTAAPRPGPPADPADHDGWVYPLAVCSPAAADRGRPHPVAGPPIVAGGRRAELINTHWLWQSVVDRGVLASSTALVDQGMVMSGRDATVGCRAAGAEVGGRARRGSRCRRQVVTREGSSAGSWWPPQAEGPDFASVRVVRASGGGASCGSGGCGLRGRGPGGGSRRRSGRAASWPPPLSPPRHPRPDDRVGSGGHRRAPGAAGPAPRPASVLLTLGDACADGPARRARQPPGVKRPAGRRPVARSSGADQPRCCWAPFPE